MWPTPTVLSADETVLEALRKILLVRVRSLPVVDAGGELVGVFGVHRLLTLVVPRIVGQDQGLWNTAFLKDSVADLRRRLGAVADEPVREHMATDFGVVHPDSPLPQTVALLHQGHDSIPVVERETGKLVGVITYWHVLDALQAWPSEGDGEGVGDGAGGAGRGEA